MWAPKQRFQVFFCKRWAPFFLEFSGILPRYLGILLGFLTNPHFWGCACTPCTPASYTAASAIHSIAADRSTNLSIGRHATLETWPELSGRVPASQPESWEEWFAVVLRGQEHSLQRPWQLNGSSRQRINFICLSEKTMLKISKVITRATFCKFCNFFYSFLNTQHICSSMFELFPGILYCNFLQLFRFLRATFCCNFCQDLRKM